MLYLCIPAYIDEWTKSSFQTLIHVQIMEQMFERMTLCSNSFLGAAGKNIFRAVVIVRVKYLLD